MADISEYEQQRLQNIQRNEEELKRLGLNIGGMTVSAVGKMAPTSLTRQRRAIPRKRIDDGTERRSIRNLGKDQPYYKDIIEPGAKAAKAAPLEDEDAGDENDEDHTSREVKRRKIVRRDASIPKSSNGRSIKNLKVDLEGLQERHLGMIIPPLGGQVKRAAMEAAITGVVPMFSRMSGIQEWENAVMLFVNVYGEGYKNVFLHGGEATKNSARMLPYKTPSIHPTLTLIATALIILKLT